MSFELQLAQESDFPQIIRIGNQHRSEMGQVLKHNLKTGVQNRTLLVAKSSSGKVIGFVLWHRRLDGWATVYDIGVDREIIGRGVGRALFNSVPRPRQLKAVAENTRSHDFYKAAGLVEWGRSISRRGRTLIHFRDVFD